MIDSKQASLPQYLQPPKRERRAASSASDRGYSSSVSHIGIETVVQLSWVHIVYRVTIEYSYVCMLGRHLVLTSFVVSLDLACFLL